MWNDDINNYINYKCIENCSWDPSGVGSCASLTVSIVWSYFKLTVKLMFHYLNQLWWWICLKDPSVYYSWYQYHLVITACIWSLVHNSSVVPIHVRGQYANLLTHNSFGVCGIHTVPYALHGIPMSGCLICCLVGHLELIIVRKNEALY